jgi:SPP1 family predicted phage head-tail adaptor
MIRAGDLKHRITIEQATETTSIGGAVSKSWSTYQQVWADIIPRGNARQYAALFQEFTEASYTFRIRGGFNIDEKMRIVHQGRYFDILYPATGADGASPLYSTEVMIVCREAQEQVG